MSLPFQHRAYEVQCVGEQPCEACASRGLHCRFDEAMDGRRKASRKRKTRDLERESNLLADIITRFRNGSSEDVSRMIALIRAVPTVDEAKDALERGVLSALLEEGSKQTQLGKEPALPNPPDGTTESR